MKFLLTAMLFCFPGKINNQQQKLYSVSMTLEQWTKTATAVHESDEISAKSSSQIYFEITSQVNTQVEKEKKAADTTR